MTTQELLLSLDRLDRHLARRDEAIARLTEIFADLRECSLLLAEAVPLLQAIPERPERSVEGRSPS